MIGSGNKWRSVSLLIILLTGIFFIRRAQEKPLGDFGNYYYGSEFLREGTFNSGVYDPWTFNRMVAEKGEKDLFLNYTPVPPVTSVVCIPLTYFTPQTAKTIFGVVGLLLFLFTLNILLRQLKDSYYLLVLPLILLIPLKSILQEGQLYLLLFSLLAGGYVLSEKKKFWLASVCFALAIHLKIFPAIILLFLLFTAQYRAMLYTVLSVVAIAIASMVIIPAGVMREYFAEILPRLMNNEINDPFATAFQSFSVFLRQLFVHDRLLNPAEWHHAPMMYTFLNGIFASLMLLIGISVTLDDRPGAFLKFSVWMIIMLLMSGYGASYAMLLLLFPVIAMLKDENVFKRFLVPLLVLSALSCSISVNYFTTLPFVLRFPRLWIMLTFFFVFLLIIRSPMKWKYALIVVLFPLASFYLSREGNDRSDYLLQKEQAMLTGTFRQNGAQLSMECYGRNGYETISVPFNGKLVDSSGFSCDGHTISLNGKLVYQSKARLRSPMLLNGDTLVFLSDKDRGVGMFALRFIALNNMEEVK